MSTPESPKPDLSHSPAADKLQRDQREHPEQDRSPDKPKRLDPTRYGDWEKNGRCIDF